MHIISNFMLTTKHIIVFFFVKICTYPSTEAGHVAGAGSQGHPHAHRHALLPKAAFGSRSEATSGCRREATSGSISKLASRSLRGSVFHYLNNMKWAFYRGSFVPRDLVK